MRPHSLLRGHHSLCPTLPLKQVIAALFGGYDTTAAVIARMVQTLGSADGKAIIHELSNELSKAITSNDTLRHGSNISSSIFKAFPLLEAIFLESYR